MKRYRVVTTDGLVLALRQGLLEACERAKDEVRRRDGIAVLVVRGDGMVMKLATPVDMNDNALWLRICRAQPDEPRGDIMAAGRKLRKKGGRSTCEHEWKRVNGNDWRCSACHAWGWQRQRYRYGKRKRDQPYPVVARVCREDGCKEAATCQHSSRNTLRYLCDLHAPVIEDAAE